MIRLIRDGEKPGGGMDWSVGGEGDHIPQYRYTVTTRTVVLHHKGAAMRAILIIRFAEYHRG